MNKEELDLLSEIELNGFVYRKFLSSKEIKIANKLVKEGLISKSYPCEKNSTIAFYITEKGKKINE